MIHSLWVPELNRKIDVIPGRTNDVVFDARSAGVFRGQCAEFCGLQHAHMALYVVAEPRGRVRALAGRRRPPRAPPPANAELERGQQVLLGSACEYCHRIAGTNASGTIGPDLTPHREPAVARRGDDPERPRVPRRLDPRPAAHQAGQQDAGDGSERARPSVAARLPGEPALMAATRTSSSCERAWAEPGALVTAIATVDHKRIGVRYLVTASVFFLLAGLEAMTHAHAAGRAERARCSRPRPTTSSSRCTASR